MIDDSVLIIEKEIFSSDGSYISNEVDEYIFHMSSNSSVSSYSCKSNTNNGILIRYNSKTNNVEELA